MPKPSQNSNLESAARHKLTDLEWEFYDKIYHPQTGGWIQGPLFRQAFADYVAGKFAPQKYMRLMQEPDSTWLEDNFTRVVKILHLAGIHSPEELEARLNQEVR